jgi:hypothetical protein
MGAVLGSGISEHRVRRRKFAGKAPAHRVVTQNNHIFAALYAFFKLECLKIKCHLHHFALRAHLCFKATRIAFDELQALKAA